MPLVLLTGGARSGKSRLAQALAGASGAPVTFIATGEARDDEMADRIRLHREARPPSWRTIEEPLDVLDALLRIPGTEPMILDCLTLWISNLLEKGATPEAIELRAEGVASAARERAGTCVVVTNEVGFGIVPPHPDIRAYRDLMGRVNTVFAAEAAEAYLVVAGRMLPLLAPEAALGEQT
jgi:adenosylcobinamide kinase/adenosylcobinamide-phosphate guanylyltransferase